MLLGAKNGLFCDWGQVQIVLGSTHIVRQLLFSYFPSILTADFDLLLGLFLTFWCSNGVLLGLIWGSKTILGSTHVVTQLSFPISL